MTSTFSPVDFGLHLESERIRTFEDWPHKLWLNDSALASEGFVFLKIGDFCKCVFCNLKLSNWVPDVNIKDRHRLGNRTCKFVMGLPVNNVTQGMEFTLSEKGIAVTSSKWSTYKRRLETFKEWELDHIVSKESLARNGFTWTSWSDHVECQECGLGLRNWRAGLDAWRQHKLFSPSCMFSGGEEGELDDATLDLAASCYTQSDLISHYMKKKAVKLAEILKVIKFHFKTERRIFKDTSEFNKAVCIMFIKDLNISSRSHNRALRVGDRRPGESELACAAATPLTFGEEQPQAQSMSFPVHYSHQYCETSNCSDKPERPLHLSLYRPLCCVCRVERITVTIKNCKHACVCEACSEKITKCPYCRGEVSQLEKVFIV